MIENFIQKAIATSRAKKVSSSYYDEVYAGEKLGMDVLIEVKQTSGKGKKVNFVLKNDDLQISFEAKEEKPLKFIPYKIKNDGTKERLPGNINYLENIQAFMNDVSVIISNTLRENRKRKLNQIIREETRRQLNELSIPHVKVNIGPYTYGVGEEQMKYLADKHRGYITNENEAEFPSLQMASEFVRDVLKDDPKADFQIYRKRSL